jgi:flagellar protein FliO/FliZ
MPDLGSLLRVVVSLGLVLSLLWFAARTLQKGRARAIGGVDVDVLARVPLAPKSALAVVRLGDQALVLGVTESRVALLTQTPVEALTVEALAASLDDAGREPVAGLVLDPVPTASRTGEPVPAGRVAARRSARRTAASPFTGSALSPQTWTRAIAAVREMTVRQ